jgi:glycosyltransferase involved in cell wall biosynthesis
VRFSVVIPAFNEARYLPRSLSSLRQASLALTDSFPGEVPQVVVVDNASTDHTAAVAREFGVEVVNEPRSGIALARNAGARNARGDVLVFIDADYRVLPSFFTRLARRYDADPEMAAAGVRVALEPAEADPITRSLSYAGLTLLRKTTNMSFGVATFRSECFQQLGGYDERLYAMEDVEILRRLAGSPYRGSKQYSVVTEVLVLASARGFHRGGPLGVGRMLSAYARTALSPSARGDLSQCGYWYDRD